MMMKIEAAVKHYYVIIRSIIYGMRHNEYTRGWKTSYLLVLGAEKGKKKAMLDFGRSRGPTFTGKGRLLGRGSKRVILVLRGLRMPSFGRFKHSGQGCKSAPR